MAEQILLAGLIWITLASLATWVHAIRTGVAPLIGPLFCVHRQTHFIGYLAAMVLLLVPTLVGAALSVGLGVVLPRSSVPAPPKNGYMEPLTPLG